jgi:hypothetical protein
MPRGDADAGLKMLTRLRAFDAEILRECGLSQAYQLHRLRADGGLSNSE